MNLPFFIARRYLFARKSHNAINIITGISVLVVAVGTMALISIMSVFNGLEDLVGSLYNSFTPEFKITPKSGKYIDTRNFPANKIRKIKGVAYYSEVLEDMALLKYDAYPKGSAARQYVAQIKGVSPEYAQMTGVDTMLLDGNFLLKKGRMNFAVLGSGVAGRLQVRLNDYGSAISVYFPNAESDAMLNPMNSFNIEKIAPVGVFSVQQEIDDKIVIVPIDFARKLMGKQYEATSIELGLSPSAKLDETQNQIKNLLGDDFVIKNRMQQNEVMYKIMKSEKWSSFLILGFILLIAIFNVVGSTTVLIIEKRKDIQSLSHLGAEERLIKRIFLFEGMLISLFGALSGLVLGLILVLLQKYFGLIPMSGGFAVDAFPVALQFTDFLAIFALVVFIGFGASIYPVRKIGALLK
ncbi:MAG: ABC transporter permease [Bacteroidetes bacterium]|nr:MAG: ABC transporter permease [Bacteroidota bacterium]